MRVFVTGSTGLVGRRLVRALLARGDVVFPLTRKSAPPNTFGPGECNPVVGDATQPGPWQEAVTTCDAVVHLAGEPIDGERWSPEFLDRVRHSRVASTRLIAETLVTRPTRADGSARTFVSTSAVGYYGADTGEEVMTEDRPAGADPLADICREWESAAAPAREAGVRVCHPRFGIVLDPDGGAFPRMARPFKWFVGGRIGSGKQYLSWIHHADLTALLLFALDTPDLAGPFHATAPTPVTNVEFSRTVAAVLGRPNWLPVPKFALRVLLGRVAEVVSGGQRALPTRLIQAGYRFRFKDLEPALQDLLKR